MKITDSESEKFILTELGQRIRQQRILLGLTQAELAEKCCISPSTETRIESGVDSRMSNYIKILGGLQLLTNFDILIPETQPDFKLLYEGKKVKQRVKPAKAKQAPGWIWGEDR